jgi:hypothetical protein
VPDLIGLICLIYPTQLPYKVKKGGVKMTLADYYNRNIPEYYDTMYLDGYTPDQIMTAFRKKMYRDYEARQEAKRAEAEANEIPNVKIISEVKIR